MIASRRVPWWLIKSVCAYFRGMSNILLPFVAATIRARPAALITRFFGWVCAAGACLRFWSALSAAHRFFWARAIRRRPAALILRFFAVAGAGAGPAALL